MTDYAYLAGLIDGEGSIMLLDPGQGRPLRATVSVGTTDKRLMESVQREFGGSLRYKKRQEAERKDMYIVEWRSGPAVALLKSCLPYFVINRRRDLAKMLVDFKWRQFRGPHNNGRDKQRYRETLGCLREDMKARNALRLNALPEYVGNEPNLSYLGAILDGEGHVHSTGRLEVWSTDPELIGYLGLFGGSCSEPKDRVGNQRPCARWWTRQSEGHELLRAALPYIRLPRKRAFVEATLGLEVPPAYLKLLPATSSEIAAATGISHTKVCSKLRSLADSGILVEEGTRNTRAAGRPPVVWKLRST